jgi:hypothetical protein
MPTSDSAGSRPSIYRSVDEQRPTGESLHRQAKLAVCFPLPKADR